VDWGLSIFFLCRYYHLSLAEISSFTIGQFLLATKYSYEIAKMENPELEKNKPLPAEAMRQFVKKKSVKKGK
jgi:hypothetical protein